MRKLVWDHDLKDVRPGQITEVSGYKVWVSSIEPGVLRVRYSEDGLSAVAPAGTIGAHWVDVPDSTDFRSTLFKSTPGDWPEDFEHENGQYQNRCAICTELFMGYKQRKVCKVCCLPSEIVAQAERSPVVISTATAMPEIRSLHDQALFDFFREFRYAAVGTNGIGGVYPRALEWIDEQVRIRVTEALKALK